jgi:hypothetical protein
MNVALHELVTKLCAASRKSYLNPYSRLQWPQVLDRDQWFMSPELISLHGTEIYEGLGDSGRKQLSFYEAVNFFSLNIHGEKALVEGLARRLYLRENEQISPYLHHFLDEENKHMVYFGGFCSRYAKGVYPDRKMVFEREYAEGEEDFLFFTKVLIFEEIVDEHNVRMAKDERLAPIARDINLIHHEEETRHLAFGRKLVRELFARYRQQWSAEVLGGVRAYLNDYLVSTWKEYYNPDAYRDAGLAEPYRVHTEAFTHARSREHRRSISARCIRYLLENEILEQEPVL